jgi:hypothetical protein
MKPECVTSPCATPDLCEGGCVYDFGLVRKVKPYPEVPPDTFVLVQRDFEVISKRLLWASAAFLCVMVANLLFAFYIMWGML